MWGVVCMQEGSVRWQREEFGGFFGKVVGISDWLRQFRALSERENPGTESDREEH